MIVVVMELGVEAAGVAVGVAAGMGVGVVFGAVVVGVGGAVLVEVEVVWSCYCLRGVKQLPQGRSDYPTLTQLSLLNKPSFSNPTQPNPTQPTL